MNKRIAVEPTDKSADLMRRAYGSYNGRKFKIEIHESTGMDLTSNWGGGSRDYFKIVRLHDGKQVSVPQSGTPFDGPMNTVIPMAGDKVPAPGIAVIEHSIFCGKDMGLTLHIHKDDATPMLPAPSEDTLSREETIVLDVSCGLKSFARREEASRAGVNKSAYDAALDSLKSKGYLNKSGAVTIKGRNARTRTGAV